MYGQGYGNKADRKSNSRFVVSEKISPDMGRKEGGYAQNEKRKQVVVDVRSISQSPRRLRAKYTHRTNFVYALCISPCRELYRQQADKFVNRCLCTYSQQSRRKPRKEDAYRQTFIYQTK